VSKAETSQRNPVGTQPHPVRASHPPEASLASSSVMAARSVDSECTSRVMEPRKKVVAGAFAVEQAGATSTHCSGLVRTVLPGSESRAYAPGGSLGTWEIPSISAPQSPAGTLRLIKSQARGWGLWHPRERKTRAQGAVPLCEGNGACGMDAGSLSPFIVPFESRETDPGEACE
jgi:hypothetical protein